MSPLANLGRAILLGRPSREATETVNLYPSQFIVDDATWRRLMRPLAILGAL